MTTRPVDYGSARLEVIVRVAVLGTGLLGSGIVQHLRSRGASVTVWNRSLDKARALEPLGAVVAASPAEAARGAERIHLVLSEDDAVDEVIAALRPGLADGVPIVDHSTNQPARVAERAARLTAEGVVYLHAPVFMGPSNARTGTGRMLIAGPTATVEALRSELEPMTGEVWHVGERPDLAAVYKLCGNAVLIGMAGVLGDMLAVGAGAGLDADATLRLFDHFQPGAAMPQSARRVASAPIDPTSFSLAMARKDVRLMIETAQTELVALPAVAAAMDATAAVHGGAADFALFARRG